MHRVLQDEAVRTGVYSIDPVSGRLVVEIWLHSPINLAGCIPLETGSNTTAQRSGGRVWRGEFLVFNPFHALSGCQ